MNKKNTKDNMRRTLSIFMAAVFLLTSIQFPAYGLDTEKYNNKDVIKEIAGYRDAQTPLAVIEIEKGTAIEDMGFPEELLVLMGPATGSDAIKNEATPADAEDDYNLMVFDDGILFDDVTKASTSDAQLTEAYKRYVSSVYDSLEPGEYLMYVPVEWVPSDDRYDNRSGTYDFTAQWDMKKYPLADDYAPDVYITVIEKSGVRPLPLMTGGSLNTKIDIGSNSYTDGQTAMVDGGDLYTITIDFLSDNSAGRTVNIDIPEGLRLVSGTGIKSVGNGTYIQETYTPSQALVFDDYPLWTYDGIVAIPGSNYYTRSGSLVYPVQSTINGGTIELNFRAESYLYDFSGDHELNDLTVEFGDASDTVTNSIGVHLKAEESDQMTATITGTDTKYLDYPFPIIVNAQENYSYLDINGAQKNNMKNIEFDLVYPTGAVIQQTSANYVMGTPVDNLDGTSTIHVKRTHAWTLWTNGGNAYSQLWAGSVTYPAAAGFSVGNSYDVELKNFTWETAACEKDGTIKPVTHTVPLTAKETNTIIAEALWHPVFSAEKKNWETMNGFDGIGVELTTAQMLGNGARSFTPVRYRFDASAIDNVSSISVPAVAEGNIIRVVYKYKGEAETVWTPALATPMPGAVVYKSVGAYWGKDWSFSADTGKYIEYAYIEYDHDYSVLPGNISTSRIHGANVAVTGRPVNDAYTGVFSHHLYSAWQSDASGNWTKISDSDIASDSPGNQNLTDHGGFRWKKPDEFKLTETATDKSGVQSYEDTTKVDGSDRVLSEYKLTNSTSDTSANPILVDFTIDSAHDNVSSIVFPYSYYADTNTAAAQVKHIDWTYTDGTTGSWDIIDSTPMPFTAGTSGGTLEAETGKYFKDLSVTLTGWNSSTQPVTAQIIGRPVDDENYTVRSKHTMTVSAILPAGSNELCTGTAGYLWTKLPPSQLQVTGTDLSVNAGAAGTMSFVILPYSGYYTHVTFAVMLPPLVTPASTQAGVYCNPNWSNQDPNGATLVSSRPATAAEIAQANANTTVDQMPSDSVIYFYEVNNQLATVYRRSLGRYCHLNVTIPIKADPLAGDQEYSYQQIIGFGTNLDNGSYTLSPKPGGDTISTPNLNNGDNGVSSSVIRPEPDTTLVINKDPALTIDESIAASDGVYKTYVAGDNSTVASFISGEPGDIKLTVTNTVDPTGITVNAGYVFVPIPQVSTPVLVKENEFNFTLNGPAVLKSDLGVVLPDEIRYLTSSVLPSASTADSIYMAGSTTYNENATMVALKLGGLALGKSVELHIPIKAPQTVSDTVKYDQFQAESVVAFQGASTLVRYNGDKSGYMRASYKHPDWTITYDSQGGSNVPSETVEDEATIYNYNGVAPAVKWTKPADPLYTGKEFMGWFTDSACTPGNEFNFALSPTADATVYAKWEIKKYIVKYDTQGGTPASYPDVTNLEWNDAIGLLPAAPSKPGFDFEGWNTLADGSGITVTSGKIYSQIADNDTDEFTTVYALWKERADVTINYIASAHGSVDNSSDTVAPATGAAAGSHAAADPGYHFTNWTKDSLSTWTSAADTLTDAELKNADGIYTADTYTAHFEPDTDTSYRVEYYQLTLTGTAGAAADYTKVISDDRVWTGTTGSAVNVADHDLSYAYKYTGFTVNTALTTPSVSGIIAGDKSTVLKVYYDRNTFTITYVDNLSGAKWADDVYSGVRYGAYTPLTGRDITTRYFDGNDYYSFTGWTPAVATYVTGDAVYTANWHKDTEDVKPDDKDPDDKDPVDKDTAISDSGGYGNGSEHSSGNVNSVTEVIMPSGRPLSGTGNITDNEQDSIYEPVPSITPLGAASMPGLPKTGEDMIRYFEVMTALFSALLVCIVLIERKTKRKI